ncbi:MAG: tRNA glutamyl-Q(34) synthetase GluQRS [Gammaproteobacteria bacterium]|nr:MAG: tRNA glutamyl-Q(34) synthetase GluQRS [Gammaproteobacteria bacterium]
MPASAYRGRFAPSPTGPLHFGSLVAAVASYLDARHHGGEWLVRMEDLDPPREMPGAADGILWTLERYGLHWDGEVIYQSHRSTEYQVALEQLDANGRLYGCACTRKEIADTSLPGVDAAVYPGTCRNGLPEGREARALRVRVDSAEVKIEDSLQGSTRQHLGREVGDFVVRRADKLVAYQLAVVVDDAAQQITHIVRGADLLDSTPRQVYLQRLLELPTPAYLHLPVAINTTGEKLSKQTGAPPVDDAEPVSVLLDVLQFLRQDVPGSASDMTLEDLLKCASERWDRTRLTATRTRSAPAGYLGD